MSACSFQSSDLCLPATFESDSHTQTHRDPLETTKKQRTDPISLSLSISLFVTVFATWMKLRRKLKYLCAISWMEIDSMFPQTLAASRSMRENTARRLLAINHTSSSLLFSPRLAVAVAETQLTVKSSFALCVVVVVVGAVAVAAAAACRV